MRGMPRQEYSSGDGTTRWKPRAASATAIRNARMPPPRLLPAIGGGVRNICDPNLRQADAAGDQTPVTPWKLVVLPKLTAKIYPNTLQVFFKGIPLR